MVPNLFNTVDRLGKVHLRTQAKGQALTCTVKEWGQAWVRAHTHMCKGWGRSGGTPAHVRRDCVAGVHAGWVGDLSPQPGLAQATDQHWTTDQEFGGPALEHKNLI